MRDVIIIHGGGGGRGGDTRQWFVWWPPAVPPQPSTPDRQRQNRLCNPLYASLARFPPPCQVCLLK